MTNKVVINNNDNESTPAVTASLLPMHIQYTGTANTGQYFTPSKSQQQLKDGSIQDIAYFRGCKLIAKTIDLESNGITGYIVNKSEHLTRIDHGSQEDEEIKTISTYIPCAKFDKLVLYGHDVPVELNNQWSLVPEYVELCNIIHE